MTTHATREQEIVKRARDEVEKRTGKTPEELFKEREKRVTDTIQLKKTDRMPVYMRTRFAIKYTGILPSAPFYDPVGYKEAVIKTILDFEPDFISVNLSPSGPALDKLDSKQYRWPGGNLRPDQGAQFVEMEIMKEDEYDLLITDPGDFILRYYMPRAYGALAPLARLPQLRSLVQPTGALVSQSAGFSSPEIIKAFEALFKAGQEQAKHSSQYGEDVCNIMGIPPLSYPGHRVATPFDLLGDQLRGMRGIMVDMFRQPEKVIAACERILEWELAREGPARPEERGRRVFGGFSHWGSEEYLSKEQFETFYWPTLKKFLLATINNGFYPVPMPEGKLNDRLYHLLELPKGKVLIDNYVLDVVTAKEVLGGHMAFMGGVPASLMWGGSPQEVDEYCKKLIKTVGKGGGYILSCAGGEEDAKVENVKAMLDAVRKYGRYD